jgi:hypothetical protein
MIEASTRLVGVEQLIDEELYFIIHAARQSGKTTYLADLTNRLNAEGNYYTVYCSLETLQYIADAEKGIPLIVKCVKKALNMFDIPKHETFAVNADYSDYAGVLFDELRKYCKILDKPLVIFFDEADCLSGLTMISFLRQLRAGYINRLFTPFVQSIVLVGMRNIRDYIAKVRDEKESLGTSSPFNVSTKAYTLKNFTKEEITQLYRQHTDETGQLFEDEAIALIYEQTFGQPWLVNAVAREVVVEMLNSDFSRSVTADMVKTAIQTIILRRDTHIDSLLERLKEERVRSVIEPMIACKEIYDKLSDNFQYVIDLGLIKVIKGIVLPSNPIYAEVILRTLSNSMQQKFEREQPALTLPHYLKDGVIDVNYLLADFQAFWRKNSAIWIERFQYKEAAPHLILQAFLQRVINGGGILIREMAAGTGQLDLGIVYEKKTYPIEIKLWKGEEYFQKGLVQTARYIDVFGSKEGWLVILDQRKGKSWKEKIYHKQVKINDIVINVFGI